VTGEASRLSQPGSHLRTAWPRPRNRSLEFKRLAETGKLRLEDPSLAAAHFNWLVLAIPLNHAMVSGDDRVPRKRELRLYANGAVRVLLAAYAMP
jgi:hypothetical protein